MDIHTMQNSLKGGYTTFPRICATFIALRKHQVIKQFLTNDTTNKKIMQSTFADHNVNKLEITD